MQKAAATVTENDFFVLSGLPPTRAQKRLAIAVVLGILTIFFVITGPLSGMHPGPIAAFLPAYLTAMFVNDSITAILLFAQFSILRSRAILVIASGYVFTALILIPYVLTFPGVFVPGGLMGGLQSTAWLYVLWHCGFPLFVIAYALSKGADPSERLWQGTVHSGIAVSVAFTAAVVLAAAIFCIAGETLLPGIMLDPLRFSPLWPYVVGAPIASLCICALIVLWIRRRSMLDLWLMVVMCLYLIEVPLSYYPIPIRFSGGWYAVRIIGFISSSLVLIVLLYEITTLYARLLHAVHAQRREREARLITGDAVAATIAHEVKQPLAGMITRADAGLRFLNRGVPELDEAREAFKQIAADGHRTGAVIESIRTIFKKGDRIRASLDLNGLITETLALAGGDLKKHRVSVETELDEHLPEVSGDRIQLQQVLVNLIANAIDSMSDIGGSRVLSVRSQIQDDGDIRISIADTGAGVGPQDIDRIFNPLFTTKANGMGMGLAICRSIMEAHDGRLWAAPNTPRGTVFHFSSAQSHTETFHRPEGQRPTTEARLAEGDALPSGAT
jgi:signal transduction histidine kinase